jgi:hypothetical protein
LIQTDEADSAGRNRKGSLTSAAQRAVFGFARNYRPFLQVFVSALAFEAGDFSVLTRYWTPFVAGALGICLVDFPQRFCVIESDCGVAFR